ncbi:PKD domain-containing protein [Ornithobacterium rhinotracheale]|uniref:PKD domain-containing protein n=1 Tax=Ornithobacterium rhinotracheale TaxID=28251 RepID=UPI00129C9647|nr:PKD domain-containing protein [Ornithobacterium rhinotracheale]MRJ11630.1 hypothetical protein [Ornithobacterium rhinotracheale]
MKTKVISLLLGLALFNFLFLSCTQDEKSMKPAVAEFDIRVFDDNYSAPVQLRVFNLSKNASKYEWDFTGSDIQKSNLRFPKTITYKTPGVYEIRLKVFNENGDFDSKSMKLTVGKPLQVDFDWEMVGSNFSPVTLKLKNKTQGEDRLEWTFDKGSPATSRDKNPTVLFEKYGTHQITLTAFNGKKEIKSQKTIEVKPALQVDFETSIAFDEKEDKIFHYIYLDSKCVSATSYRWTCEGAVPATSTERELKVYYPKRGKYKISLEASNDKETKKIEKYVEI